MQSIDVAKYVRPCKGHRAGGDVGMIITLDDHDIFLAIVDVLGHGLEAHQLALIIERFLRTHACADIRGLLDDLHRHIRGSRGAGAGLCYVEAATGTVRYVGIGNTVIRTIGKESLRLISQDGILGQHLHAPRLQQLSLGQKDVLLLYTDGVSDRFQGGDYPQIVSDSAEWIARTIVQRFGKSYDDAGCIALRYRR